MGEQNKTQPTDINVIDFIASIDNEGQRRDIETLVGLFTSITGAKPVIWGTSIIGFGTIEYRGKSGRSGIWMKVGLAARKNMITIYLTCYIEKLKEILAKLGPHKTGVGCLYIKRLSDIDIEALKHAVIAAIADKPFQH